jgi:PEGA domain
MTPGRADLRITFLLASVIALSAAFASPARAGGDVGVIVTGEGSIQPQLAAQISDWLSRHGHTVVASPLPADAIPLLVDCFVMEKLACARNIVETRAKSASVVFARVDTESDPDNGARNVTLTAYWFAKGHDAVGERRTCERCTAQALRTTADEVMKKLVGRDGHVKLRSTPPGARIVIDGQAIGVTPLDWDLSPGKHTIRMDMQGPGLVPASREVVVVSDRTELVDLSLIPPAERTWLRRAQVSMMIGGGALLLAGGVMIAIDQDAVPEAPPRIRNSGPPGLALAITGAVVGGAGYWWFRSSRKSSLPVAMITSDTAYVGWSGRF